MAARYAPQKGDSIFESSLSNALIYLWLAAHSLGLAAVPVSGVKYPKVQGLVKHLFNLPDFIYVYDLLLVGRPAEEGGPSGKLNRHVDEMVHHDRAADDELMSEEALRADRQAPRRQRGAARGGGQDRALNGGRDRCLRRAPRVRHARRGGVRTGA